MNTSIKIRKKSNASSLSIAAAAPLANDMVVEILPMAAVKEPDRKIRVITNRAIATAKAILEKLEQPVPVVVSDDGTIIMGTEFFLAARELGHQSIKIVRMSKLSREHARVLTIALARLPELSTWDKDALRLEFQELIALDLDIDLHDFTGHNIAEMDIIIEGESASNKPNPLDNLPETPSSDETITRAGDVWHLNLHHLLCDTALEADSYVRLLGDRVIRMLFSDAPYGLRIKGNVSRKHEDFAMGVGEQTSEEFTVFLETMIVLAVHYLVDGGLAYLFMDRRHLLEIQIAARRAGLSILDLCFWNKMSGGMGGLYRSQHEPCFVFKHGKAPHINNVELGKHGRHRTNVWDHRGLSSFGKGRDEALAQHPTIKPVNLLAEAIKDCTKRGEIVLDPFMGSGSTILAAETTGRIAYGIELEPRYVYVAIVCWQNMTGKQAVLESTGQTFDELRADQLAGRERSIPQSTDDTTLTV